MFSTHRQNGKVMASGEGELDAARIDPRDQQIMIGPWRTGVEGLGLGCRV